jgi:hypothetical protein
MRFCRVEKKVKKNLLKKTFNPSEHLGGEISCPEFNFGGEIS